VNESGCGIQNLELPLAVNFHDVPRMAYDIDLMILLEPENILKLVTKLNQ
jgi:hypothetical protein